VTLSVRPEIPLKGNSGRTDARHSGASVSVKGRPENQRERTDHSHSAFERSRPEIQRGTSGTTGRKRVGAGGLIMPSARNNRAPRRFRMSANAGFRQVDVTSFPMSAGGGR
jgi:hypothetical protein